MTQISHKPGSIIAVRHSTYTHYGIVSDRYDETGAPMVIDNSAAKGLVHERTWNEAVGNKPVSRASFQSMLPPEIIVLRARQHIGKLKYCLFSSNCEAFARRVAGLEPKSHQIAACGITAPTAAYFTFKATDGNWFWTLVAATAAVAATTYAVGK